jgi:DNA primase catalytic subunit
LFSSARLFPFDAMFKWLNYDGEKDCFAHREFSFQKNEQYMRFNSYNDRNSLANAIIKLAPQKIDIGAIYPVPVSFVCCCCEEQR